MTKVDDFVVDEQGRKIGPVAQHLLLENDEVKIWQVATAPGETFWHHYHNYDYVLFHLTEMLGVVYNAEADHERAFWSGVADRHGPTVRAGRRDNHP